VAQPGRTRRRLPAPTARLPLGAALHRRNSRATRPKQSACAASVGRLRAGLMMRDKEHRVMDSWTLITQLWTTVREFIVPTYRPELHYMRGPGPAYARV